MDNKTFVALCNVVFSLSSVEDGEVYISGLLRADEDPDKAHLFDDFALLHKWINKNAKLSFK